MKLCASCLICHPRDHFSNRQWKTHKSICSTCVDDKQTRKKDNCLANETSEKSSDKAASIQPTLISDVPGVDFEAYTEDPIVACLLFGINSVGWAEIVSKRLIAFVHVMNRLLDRRDASAIHKLNGLLELSVERYESFSKTTEQVFAMDDMYSALDYQRQVKNVESREMDFEEAVLEWYASNNVISLEDRKATLPKPWLESLVGLRLSTSHGIFILDRVDYSAEDGKYYICKYDDEDDNKDYPMTYYNVVEYADHEQPGFSQFHLPKEPLCVHVDCEFRARCDTTLQELRGVHSSSADCYLEKAKILCNHAIREVGVYIDTHLVTPERIHPLKGTLIPLYETEEEKRARQENDARRHARVRVDQKAKSLKIAALNNVSDVPGNGYNFE